MDELAPRFAAFPIARSPGTGFDLYHVREPRRGLIVRHDFAARFAHLGGSHFVLLIDERSDPEPIVAFIRMKYRSALCFHKPFYPALYMHNKIAVEYLWQDSGAMTVHMSDDDQIMFTLEFG